MYLQILIRVVNTSDNLTKLPFWIEFNRSAELYLSIMPSTSDLADPKEYQKILHWAETQKDGTIPSFATRRNDPYEVSHCTVLFEIGFVR